MKKFIILATVIVAMMLSCAFTSIAFATENSSTALVAPTAKASKVSGYTNYYEISWNAIEGADGYEIWFSKGGKTATMEKRTIYTDPVGVALEANFIYSFTVRAYTENEDGSFVYGPFSKAVKASYFATLDISSFKAKKKSMKLSWGKYTNATGYAIYKKTGTGKYKLLKVTKKTSFADKKVKVGYLYTYYLKAYRGTFNKKTGKGSVWTKKSKACLVCYACVKNTGLAGSKDAQAKTIAKRIVKCIGKKGKDLVRVQKAAYAVACFASAGKYTMKGSNYSTAYGVFVKGEYSCAGCTRALGMCLSLMGFKWKHANENAYTHQWCTLKMDGKKGWADGMMGGAGYGKWGNF